MEHQNTSFASGLSENSDDGSKIMSSTSAAGRGDKVARNGFCVICEEWSLAIDDHLIEEHQDSAESPWNPCYEVVCFNERYILAPRGVDEYELTACPTCFGVFYGQRVNNHKCGHPLGRLIEEGSGPHFCLLCQIWCDDIQRHLAWLHCNNRRLEVRTVVVCEWPIQTIMPVRTDVEREVVYYHSCDCGACLPFAYKKRLRRLCPARAFAQLYVSDQVYGE